MRARWTAAWILLAAVVACAAAAAAVSATRDSGSEGRDGPPPA